MRKRILSIILAVLMLVSVLPVTALAAEPTTDPDLDVSTKTSEGTGPKIEKSAKWVDKENGIAEITFKVTGEEAETSKQKLDIVLVIDKSKSMDDDNRMRYAKAAAKAFVSSVLDGSGDSVRVAVVAYAGSAKLHQKFSTNAKTINDSIDAISTDWYTNTQAGIYRARTALTGTADGARTDAKKIMIVLADGDANYGYEGGDWHYVQPDEAQTYHILTSDFSWVYDNFYYSYGSNEDSSVKAVSEALRAKKAGVTIYSIGYGIGKNSWAEKTMKSVASSDKNYKAAGTDADAIKDVFGQIAQDIKFKAYDVSLTDTMGDGFTFVEGSATTNGGTVTATANGLSWEVADQLDENEKNLTFRVKYDTENPSYDALLATNGKAELKYAEEENGTADKTVGVDSPELPNLARTLTYKDGYSTNGTAGLKDEHAQVRAWYGTEVTVTDVQPTRDGYVFDGWDSATANEKITLTENKELTAQWKDDESNVKCYLYKEWIGKVGTSVSFQIKRDGENYSTPQEMTEYYKDKSKSDENVTVWGMYIWVPKWQDEPNAQGVKELSQYTIEEVKLNGSDLVNNKLEERNSDGVVTGTWTAAQKDDHTVTNTYVATPTHTVTYRWATSAPDTASLPKPNPVEGVLEGSTYTVTADGYDDVQGTVNGKVGVWHFEGWTYNGQTVSKGSEIPVNDDIVIEGSWSFTNNKYMLGYIWGSPNPGTSADPYLPDMTYNLEQGMSYDVAWPTTTTIEGEKDGVSGIWTFKHWEYNGQTYGENSQVTMGSSDITMIGIWEFNATVGNYKVIEYYMQADGTYDDGTVAESDTRALGEWTYTPDATKSGGYTLNETKSELTKTITATETAEYKVYYDLSSGSKVTKVAKVKDVETDEADVGDTIDYYITVSNVGGLDLTNLTLTDTFNRADLRFEDGEGYTVTPVEGEEGKWTITIPSLTVADHEITIHAAYTVVDTDSGRTLKNVVAGEGDDKDESIVTVDEVTHNNVVINVEKTVTSKRGTAPRNEGYVFVAYYVDELGTEHELGRKTIYMSESATKDDPKTETGKIRFTLSAEEYAQLPKEGNTPYLYVREIPGENAFTEYDSAEIKGYVMTPLVVNSVSLDEPTYNEVEYIVWPEDSLSNVFAFENIYNKPTSRVDPIKVGPQLNRDDHVAYIMGYPDGTVQPEGQITRAEACTIFFRLLTEESRNYYFARSNDYTDVKSTDWYNNAISTLSNAGIVTGYNDGTFRPNQPITRGEMAKIIANFANLNKGTKSFTDLNGHWSKTYVELAAGNGWIAGYPDGTFRPDQKITRAETVTMINRVLERVPAKETRLLSRSIMLTFPDNNPGDWYYIAIQEASNSHEYQRSVYEAEGDEMWLRLRDNVDWTKLEK